MIDDPSMRFQIDRIETFHVVFPATSYWRDYRSGNRLETARYVLKPGWRTVYGTRIETALLKVTLTDGTVGWGEATEPICPEVICQLALELLSPLVRGTTFENPGTLWDFCYDLNRGRGHLAGYHLLAMAALDIAVWDALGHRAGVPLAELASGSPHRSVPVYLSGIRRGTIDERVELLRSQVAQGLSAAKIFVDSNTEATIAEVSALREGVDGNWKLMVDALWSYDNCAEALRLRQELDAFDVGWLECPLVPEDLEAHVSLASAPGVPIALGEHFFTIHQSRPWIKAAALNVFQPDIGRTGFSGGLVQARMANDLGLTVTPHMGTGSLIIQSAALQFWSACCGCAPCELQLDLTPLLHEAFDSGWQYEEGEMKLPRRPGLGVSVHQAALERYCAHSELSA